MKTKNVTLRFYPQTGKIKLKEGLSKKLKNFFSSTKKKPVNKEGSGDSNGESTPPKSVELGAVLIDKNILAIPLKGGIADVHSFLGTFTTDVAKKDDEIGALKLKCIELEREVSRLRYIEGTYNNIIRGSIKMFQVVGHYKFKDISVNSLFLYDGRCFFKYSIGCIATAVTVTGDHTTFKKFVGPSKDYNEARVTLLGVKDVNTPE